ncbi:MAG TPA: phosphotransferase [Candidatus Dormibacteraeota bacterium]|nr:phosphotransferase [Candidatus Dormibacteraeota bacterium]
MGEATDKASVAGFVEEVLDGSGWELSRVKRRSSRLEPPDSYWTLFDIAINKDEEERRLRLVAKGALNPAAWERLSSQLVVHGGEDRRCDPIGGLGYPKLFPESKHAYWFYPFDPAMPGLSEAADPVRMARLLVGLDGDNTSDILSVARRLEIERVRYMPEISAILRYRLDSPAAPVDIYGKVQPGNRGLRTNRIVNALWQASKNHPGYLKLPRQLGFVDHLGLLLEERVPGLPVSGHRANTEFRHLGHAAAEALAVIHESKIEVDAVINIEHELARLDRVAEQFTYVLPTGHFLLTDLIAHMRDRLRKTQMEEILPTHGDLKYDQFIHHNGEFTLIDFDYFAMAETSYDLGKFCAYTVPSTPRDWRESVAAEETRASFIQRYMELRPGATLQRFAVYEALQLALRAMAAMWSQSSGWERVAETFLVMAFERLKTRLPG